MLEFWLEKLEFLNDYIGVVHVIDVTKKGPALLRQNHLVNISAGPAYKLCSKGGQGCILCWQTTSVESFDWDWIWMCEGSWRTGEASYSFESQDWSP